MPTLTFYNFKGSLTRFPHGAANSGKAIDRTTFGHQPWSLPGCINFNDKQVDITKSIINDAIIAQRTRTENGILYVYAIGHTGRLYKIQVNDPLTKNIQFDDPQLICTLTTANSFTMGGSIIFYGDTEKIFIGHDAGVTKIDFDGRNEAFVGDVQLWEQNVPRQAKIFFKIMYWTNGSNIASIDTSENVLQYQNIDTLPTQQIFKCIESNSTGDALIIVSSDVPNTSLLSSEPNLNASYSAQSYFYRWDGISKKVKSTNAVAFDQTAALTSGNNEFMWGYDVPGGSLFNIKDGLDKIVSGTGVYLISQAPTANSVVSSGNLVGWGTVEPYPTTASSNKMGASFFVYGNLDRDESDQIYSRFINFPSALPNGDILRVTSVCGIGNIQTSGDTSGYGSGLTKNQTGTGRVYIGTVEWDGVDFYYGFYSFSVVNPFLDPCAGVYETQSVLCGSEDLPDVSTITPTAVRTYLEPATGYEALMIDLIGIDGLPISSDTHSFSAFGTPSVGTITLDIEPSDGDTIDVTDALLVVVTYEFDDGGGVLPGNVAVLLQGSAALTVAELATTIEGNQDIVTADGGSGSITLTDNTAGVSGNVAITFSGSISVTGMSGGVDPDISTGQKVLTYTPTGSETAALGVRVTNSGLFTPLIHKVEVDY